MPTLWAGLDVQQSDKSFRSNRSEYCAIWSVPNVGIQARLDLREQEVLATLRPQHLRRC